MSDKSKPNTSSSNKSSLTYKDAGVDIEAGDAFVDVIKPFAKSTLRDGCLSGLGGFGALFEVPKRYDEPILVSGTDGVGTKLKLAFDLDKHDTIGIDLVAMCVNDILVQGAEPLFFLDYFATGKLSTEKAADVVKGIAEGCRQSNAALIGGETAEMPGMYAEGEYDLAGFTVGAVEKSKIIDGSKVQAGDIILGLPSSGAHSNGYSLIRKVIDTYNADLNQPMGDTTLAEAVLAPTTIYVKPILELLKSVDVHTLAHITGGGIPGNLVRVLPDNCHAILDENSWEWPPLFNWLAETANIARDEMYRTFNCGIGMMLCVAPEDKDSAIAELNKQGTEAIEIGSIQTGDTAANGERVTII